MLEAAGVSSMGGDRLMVTEFLSGDEDVLELDQGGGFITLWIVYFKMVNIMLREFYLNF